VAPTLKQTAGARHTSNLISGFYWIKQLRILAVAAAVLGIPADTARWQQYADRAAASYNTLFYDAAKGR